MSEPGRALNISDVAEVTALAIVTTIPVSPAIARGVDAGVCRRRRPPPEGAPLRRRRDFRPPRSHHPNYGAVMGDKVEQLQAKIEAGVAALIDGDDWQQRL